MYDQIGYFFSMNIGKIYGKNKQERPINLGNYPPLQ